jgi:hypothetical protein
MCIPGSEVHSKIQCCKILPGEGKLMYLIGKDRYYFP